MKSVIQETISKQQQQGQPPLRAYFTGHSLGAVFAQYAAAAARNSGLDVSGVYVFASPNTGGIGTVVDGTPSHSWVQQYSNLGLDKRTWLFNNPDDLVPTVPIGWRQGESVRFEM